MAQGLRNCQTHSDRHDTVQAGSEVENVLVANAGKGIAIRGRTKVVVARQWQRPTFHHNVHCYNSKINCL